MENEMIVNTYASGDVKDLEMRIAAATVKTKEAADGEIRVEARNLQGGRYTCEVKAGKLVVTHEMEGIMHLPRIDTEETQIVLYLPANLTLGHATVEIGAGSVYLDAVPISCSKMKVEVGAGKWKAAQLSVSDSLNVEIGAGKAKMKGVTAGRVSIQCGVGSSTYKGRINGDIKVGCGVGSCVFELANKESDFNYDVSCAVGSVKINSNKIKSFASRKSYKNGNALGTAVLDCGLGSIELRTDEIGVQSVK